MNDEKSRAQILAENLSNIRQQKKISRKALAAAVGVNEVSYGKYERAESSPSYDKLFVIAEKLDCSIADLLGENPNVKDRQIFKYRLQKAIDTAKILRCEISFLADGKVSLILPPSISIENAPIHFKNKDGDLIKKGKFEVNYDISFAPIVFDDSKVFVSVMEDIEKSALLENNFFLKKFQDTFFKTNRRIKETNKTA